MKITVLVVLALAGGVALLLWTTERGFDTPSMENAAERASDSSIQEVSGLGAAGVQSSNSTRRSVEGEPSPKPSATGSLSITVEYETGGAAPGIYLRVERLQDDGAALECFTDQDGHSILKDVQPGDVIVHTLRSAFQGQVVSVDAGRQSSVAIVVDAGIRVTGVVVDRIGNSVPGAQIEWVLDGTGKERAVRCGISDSQGRFDLTGIPRRAYVGARKLGYVASLFAHAATPGIEIVIRLLEPGGAIHGRVVDTSGSPVRGASIAVGVGERAFVNRMSTEYGRSLCEILALSESDANGEFAMFGIPSKPVVVHCRHVRFGTWTGSVEVLRNSTSSVLARLERSGRVRVVVRDPANQAVENVRVALTHQLSKISVRGATDKDGSFAANNVAAGEFTVRVSDGVRDYERSLRVDAGADVDAAFTVDTVGSIVGVVVDPSGIGRPDMLVRAQLSPSGESRSSLRRAAAWRREVETDEHGQFSVRDIPRNTEFRISVIEDRFLVGMIDKVRPDGVPVVIRVDTTKNTGYGTIRGMLMRSDRLSPAALNVGLVGLDIPGRVFVDLDEGGSFERKIREGRYEVRASGRGVAGTRFGPYAIASGKTLDVGRLAVTEGGRLSIRVVGPRAAAVELLTIHDVAGRRVGDVFPRGNIPAISSSLPAGDYRVVPLGPVSFRLALFRVSDGQTTPAVVTVLPGRKVRLFHAGSHALTRRRNVTVTVRRAGEDVHIERVWSGPGGEWEVRVGLEPANYRVSWSSEGGTSDRADFVVRHDTEAVELR